MEIFNWQYKDWPEFRFSLQEVETALFSFSEKAGRVSGILAALPIDIGQETIVDIILSEAIKTSEIEGEYPNRSDVLSSIRKNIGLIDKTVLIKDPAAKGLGELMISVRETAQEPLTEEILFSWHNMLMGSNKNITVGKWRTHEEPMQIISGAMGKEKVHFEAPPSVQVPIEMSAFLQWFNDTAPSGTKEIKHPLVRAAIAHLYFESIHPFEDGNGRIGRAIAEKALSQTLGRPVLMSLSQAIEAKKKDYYAALEKAQRSNEITQWIIYFVQTTLTAQDNAETHIEFVLKKTRFFDCYKNKLNTRQMAAVKRMFEEGPKGFTGGMNTRKYIGIAKTSKATATRDLQQLVALGALIPGGGGRSTSYHLRLE